LVRLSPEKLEARSNKAFADRDANRNLFDDCYELLSPYRNTLNNVGKSFNKPTRQYDSTGQISAASFVNTIQSNFTPVFTKWANLTAGDGVPEDKRPALNEMLERITDQIFSYLNASNFATASSEMYFEWGIGTGCLWLHEGDEQQPLNFIATPISQIGIAEGKFGTIDYRTRKHVMKGGLVKETWPNAKIPAKMEQDFNQSPDKEVTVLECFYYDYEDLLWRYDVIIDKECILYEEHKTEICFTPRWLKIPSQAHGIGPFIMALADIKTLNVLKEFLLRSSALDVAGVYTVSNDGALNPNTLNIAPNTFIPVERNSGENGPSIQRLDTSANFQLQEYIANGLQDQIRKTLLDNRLPAETPQPKTAFEIAQRMREFQVDIGSAYGRGMFEFIQPMFRRIVDILVRKGLLDLPEGFTIDNFFIKVQVTSPIAQTQQAEEVQRVMQNYQMIAMVNPQLAMTAYEVEKFPQWLTEMTGTPTKLLRNEAEAAQLQQLVAQIMVQSQLEQQQPPA
jgi:hypothetical protein